VTYFVRHLPWLIWNSRKHPGILRAAFVAATTGKTPLLA
jgi:hypothetical protein